MPEGPEIRREADRLRKVLVGRVASSVFFGLPRLEAFGPQLQGRKVEALESRGKALLTHFEQGLTVYSHNQLYGRWYVVAAGSEARTGRQLRFAVETETHRALLYSASDIEVLASDGLEAHPFLARIGPDALDPATTPADIEAQLARCAGRRLSALLLDQGFVAGIGNYLRSEILFEAGVLPHHRPKDLSPRRRARVAEMVLEVTRRAYASGGITVTPELDRQLKKEGLRKRERRHYVFGRRGRVCRRCETPVGQTEAGGRRIYTCPGCQI